MKAKHYETLLQALSQVVGEGIHIINAEGITIVYNEAMAVLEKTRREDVLGKPFREVFSNIPEDQSTLSRALKKGLPTKKQPQTYLNKYGNQVSTVNSTVPVMDSQGSVIFAIEIAQDITHIKQLSDTILDLQSGIIPHAPVTESKIKTYRFENIVGKNKKFMEVLDRAKRAAKISTSVFIYGETGTGKEMIAQSIHFSSDRKGKPLLAQNCAALPESLLEGILFGTSKGGFTGALDRQGLFEQANGGTLLLDEISAMPYELQSKLLRVLQEDYIRRIGGTKDIPIDVRIIATVNESPQKLIENGKLRKDLYYRLNVIDLSIPPLRDRPDDIILLAESFLEKYDKRFKKEVWALSDGAKEKLLSYDYPGNTRELENIIMSAVALSDSEHVLTQDLLDIPSASSSGLSDIFEIFGGPHGMSLNEYTGKIEKDIICKTLEDTGGNISKAAEHLGIQRQTLQHKIKKYK